MAAFDSGKIWSIVIIILIRSADMEIEFNWLAIAAGAVASMISGMIWYHPKVYGDKWMKSIGLTKKKLEKDQKKSYGNRNATLGSTVILIVQSYLCFNLVLR